MNTFDARSAIRDLALEALAIVERIPPGGSPSVEDRRRLRELSASSRDQLADAGYPAESAWRALQRASIAADTFLDSTDPTFWRDVADQLREGVGTLDALISPAGNRESDFRVIG